ncbi:MAG: YeeE/YedE thiosulfate transporter family protein [Thermodesulfovibrionales bacterium]
MGKNHDKGWNPYLAGALSGLLIVLAVWLTGNYFGASTSFVRTAAIIESLLAPARAASIEYYRVITPQIDWQWMFVVGILAGSFVSAVTSGSFKWRGVPELWQARFGPGPLRRGAVAFAGGVLMIIGARIAGGCTSGHGLSGSLQLAVSGLLTLAFIFAGGILTANVIYRGGKK